MQAGPPVQGYVTDVAYPPHFHRETTPVWLHAAAAALGFRAADPAAPYDWCELGCGSGANAVLTAAANPRGRFLGIDVNPAHVAAAEAFAAAAGTENVRFLAADFAAAAEAPDAALPMFDFIVLHGVWSWISGDARRAVLRFVERRLKPGGLVHVAYMTHPGSSFLAGLQKLMLEHARHQPGGSEAKARAALALVQRLSEAGTGYFAAHPEAERQLEAMGRELPAYLAHEFLAEHWQPMHVADVMREFAAIGCGYLGSATLAENIDALSVPGHTLPLLREMPTPALAETVKDLARNQSQRRDLYQRTPAALDAAAHLRTLDALRLALLPGAPAPGALRFGTRVGPVEGPAELFAPVLQALAAAPRSFAELRTLPVFRDNPGLLNQVLQMLVWAGHAHWLRGDWSGAEPGFASGRELALEGGRWRLAPAAGTALQIGG